MIEGTQHARTHQSSTNRSLEQDLPKVLPTLPSTLLFNHRACSLFPGDTEFAHQLEGPDLTSYEELVLEGPLPPPAGQNERTLFLFDKLLITKKR